MQRELTVADLRDWVLREGGASNGEDGEDSDTHFRWLCGLAGVDEMLFVVTVSP